MKNTKGKKTGNRSGKKERQKVAGIRKEKTAKKKPPNLEVIRLDEAAERKRRAEEYDEILEFVLEDLDDMADGLTEAALNIACVDEWKDWADTVPEETEVELDDDAFDGCNDENIQRLIALRTEIDRVALEIERFRKQGIKKGTPRT